MKLITLNTWGGRSLYPLMEFIKQNSTDTDIFCFQEVFDSSDEELDRRHPGTHAHAKLFKTIADALPDFNGTFAVHEDDPHRMSLATFVRRTIPVSAIDDFVVYEPEMAVETGNAVISKRKLQHFSIKLNGKDFTIINFHGLWVNGPKTDTPPRIEQAKLVNKFLNSIDGPKIICGDFNLLPETESLKIMEQGMRNLVKEAGVDSTRTPLYRHYENPDEPNFADYIIVSPDVNVTQFKVMKDLVSDHSPLFVEFN